MKKRLLLPFIAVCFASLPAFGQAPAPISEVIGVDQGYVFLKVPTSFVSNCLTSTRPLIQARAEHFSTRNGASNRQENITINPDGTYTPQGSSRPAIPNPAFERTVFYKTLKCEVPVLTAEQLRESRLNADAISAVPPYDFRYVPSNIIDYRETDLVKSRRDRTFRIPGFAFNSNFSGGLDPYLKGSSIGNIINNPGSFGLQAVYYMLGGQCDRVSSIAELNANCSDSALRNAAEQATSGVGITILRAK